MLGELEDRRTYSQNLYNAVLAYFDEDPRRSTNDAACQFNIRNVPGKSWIRRECIPTITEKYKNWWLLILSRG